MYVYSNTVIDVKTLMWGLQARKQIHCVFIEDYFSPADEAVSSSHSSISDPFDDCDLTSTFPPAQNDASQNELERYLAEYPESRNTNIVAWWRSKQQQWPCLTQMARDYLAVPASSVPSEQVFSQAGHVLSKRRSRMEPETMGAVMCLKSWLGSDEIREAVEEMKIEVDTEDSL